MQASRFISLVKNVTDLRAEELDSAKALAKQFPYSQLIHLIVARASRDQKSPDAEASLHRAAVYATDRAILKSVMTRAVQPRVEISLPEEEKKLTAPAPVVVPKEIPPSKPVAAEPEKVNPVVAKPETVRSEVKTEAPKAETGTAEQVKPKLSAPVPSPEPQINREGITLEGDALRSDLEHELTRLHELMGAFDATYEKLKKGEPINPAPAPKPVAKKPSPKPSPSAEPTPAAEVKASPVSDAPLIEEIKSSKRKPKIVSPKVAEQGEIIDQFIKVAPTLPRTKPTEPTTDLAEDSVNIADNIVSETLVEILLKQGKKAKAIEMLKKLIWKFPQKKAYFAAQIEALKS